MKRMMSLLLVVLMSINALSFAEDKDPIVGCWYVLLDAKSFPEEDQKKFSQSWETYRTQLEFYLLRFTEHGEIFEITGVFEEYQTDAEGHPIVGTWIKDSNGSYRTTIVGGDTGPAYLDGDKLVLLYMRGVPMFTFRRMATFDLANDVVRK